MSADHIGDLVRVMSLGVLTRAIPMADVEAVLAMTGRASQRERRLPAHLVVYLTVLMGLLPEVSAREALRTLLATLRPTGSDQSAPVASAISAARNRLGKEPMEALFHRVVRPAASRDWPGAFVGALRVVAADGSEFDVQHTAQNIERFGIHHNQHGPVGYPALQAVVLIECATRIPLAAAIGGVHDDEAAIFDRLTGKLASDMLLLVDRHFYSFSRWQRCASLTGGLLWRIRSNIFPRVVRSLPDGSALVELRPSNKLIRSGAAQADEVCQARLIECVPRFEDGTEGEVTRLLTNLTDHAAYPAGVLAQTYMQRWGAETAFDEFKTHLRGPGRVLRSQLPDLVEQDFFASLLAYYAVRTTMADAALVSGVPSRELSFVHGVRVVRRKLDFPPSGE